MRFQWSGDDWRESELYFSSLFTTYNSHRRHMGIYRYNGRNQLFAYLDWTDVLDGADSKA